MCGQNNSNGSYDMEEYSIPLVKCGTERFKYNEQDIKANEIDEFYAQT